MNGIERIMDCQPTFRHVGYVVKDIRSAAEKLTACFPMMDAWKFCVAYMASDEVADGRACRLIIALARVNGTAIELIEVMPDTPDCYHAEQADWSAHVSYVYPAEAYDEVYEYLLAHGYKIVFGANQKKSGEKCYYFAPVAGGPVVELNNMFPDDPEYDTLDEALRGK